MLCATPDHLHAYVSILSMRAGKHVYCEKPLTHNIWEARKVAQVAKETGAATQMGNSGHSNVGIRQTCEWIWDGAIGPVREVHAWVGANRWNKQLTGAPAETPPVPDGVNWDLWLGPREVRPYHPPTRRSPGGIWAFGGGGLATSVATTRTPPLGRRPGGAAAVESRPAGNMDAEIAPHGEICYYEFDARGEKPPVRLTWYDGGLRPPCPDEIPAGGALPSRGSLFIGERGKMLCDGAGGPPRLLPYEKTPDYAKPAETIPRSRGHHRDWLDANKGAAGQLELEYSAR